MSLVTPPSAQIQIWREKIANGTITQEELRQAIQTLREGRLTASPKARSAGSGSTRKVGDSSAAQTAEDLLQELGDL